MDELPLPRSVDLRYYVVRGEPVCPEHGQQLRASAAADGGGANGLSRRLCGRRTCGRTRRPRVRRRRGDCTGQRPGSWRTTRARPSTTTSPPSSGRGNRHNPLTRTPTPFPTVCSPRPNSSVTSTTAADRVSRTLDSLTEDAAARPLPGAHRYHGMLYGVIVGSIPLHVLEHASQIRQFLTAAGIKVQPMPGDRGYAG